MPTQDPGHRPFGHVGEPGDLRRVPAGFLPGGQDPAPGFGTGPGRAGLVRGREDRSRSPSRPSAADRASYRWPHWREIPISLAT